MDPRTEPNSPRQPARHLGRPAGRAERWYVNVQGRTLGPLESAEVKAGLESGEFLGSDKISPARQPAWQTISEHSLFGTFVSADEAPLSAFLVPPPPPSLLRAKAPPPPHLPAVVPAKPEPLPEPEPKIEVAEVKVPEPVFAAPPAAAEDLITDPETNAALEQATRELERMLSTLKKAETPAAPTPRKEAKPEIHSAIPSRPDYEPVFIGDPEPRYERAAAAKLQARVIQIEFKLPERPLHWLVLAVMLLAVAAYFGNGIDLWRGEDKTRGLKDFRLPDPSSPADLPIAADDPPPPLKAPTRPQRN